MQGWFQKNYHYNLLHEWNKENYDMTFSIRVKKHLINFKSTYNLEIKEKFLNLLDATYPKLLAKIINQETLAYSHFK